MDANIDTYFNSCIILEPVPNILLPKPETRDPKTLQSLRTTRLSTKEPSPVSP